jgi:hypothetical protein
LADWLIPRPDWAGTRPADRLDHSAMHQVLQQVIEDECELL